MSSKRGSAVLQPVSIGKWTLNLVYQLMKLLRNKDEIEDSSAQMQERKRLSCSNHDKQAFSVHDEFQVLKEA